MQLNVLYLVIVSTGIAISSNVYPRANTSCLNATTLTATNASTDTNSPLKLTVWTGPNCTGYMSKVGPLSSKWYGAEITLFDENAPFSSFRLSRPLKEREQLDFSQALESEKTPLGYSQTLGCGRFLRSYGPQDSPAGCANLNTFACLQICLTTSSSTTTSSTTTISSTATSSTTTSANAGATVAFAENTFYRLSNNFLGAGYSVTNMKENDILSRKLNMTITGNDIRQYWQIKRTPNTDNWYWFAGPWLGKNMRLSLDPLNLINPLMVEADDTAIGQQWNVQRMPDGTWRIRNALPLSSIWNFWRGRAQLNTYSDTYSLFMDMDENAGTQWSIEEVRKISAADGFL